MRRRVGAALFLALFVSGCSAENGQGEEVTIKWRRDPSLPCPHLYPPSPPSRALDIEPLHDLPLEVSVGPVKLWGPYLSYPVDRRRVVLCNLANGEVAVVAERRASEGTVYDYVVGSGERVVYTRLSTLPNVLEKVNWAIEAVNVSTGERRVLAELHQATPDLVPRPAANDRFVAWTHETNGGVAVRVHELTTGDERELAPAKMQAGNVGITEDDLVVFDGESGLRRRDVFAVPADGSTPPRRLTDQGAVQPLIVANGRVTWRNSVPGAEAAERWTMVVGRNDERTLVPVRVEASGRAVPGAEFLVTEDGGGLMIHAVVPGTPPVPLVMKGQRLDRGALWDVRGDIVVWVGVDYPPIDTVRRHLHLARVRFGTSSEQG